MARLHGLLSRLDDRIIVCSDHVGRYMVQTGRAPAQKIRLVYYGIDLDRPLALSAAQAREVRRDLDLPPGGPFLLCVARLDPQKGHPYLIEAMRGVLERFPDARLVLVGAAQQGSEEYVAALREQAAGAELVGKVAFAGERQDVPRLMAAADVFVLASLWEGFGLVFAEAMGAGTPVVGTRVSARPGGGGGRRDGAPGAPPRPAGPGGGPDPPPQRPRRAAPDGQQRLPQGAGALRRPAHGGADPGRLPGGPRRPFQKAVRGQPVGSEAQPR